MLSPRSHLWQGRRGFERQVLLRHRVRGEQQLAEPESVSGGTQLRGAGYTRGARVQLLWGTRSWVYAEAAAESLATTLCFFST